MFFLCEHPALMENSEVESVWTESSRRRPVVVAQGVGKEYPCGSNGIGGAYRGLKTLEREGWSQEGGRK